MKSVAVQAGIPAAVASGGLSPQGKAEVVRRLQDGGQTVAMVGDGVNDAPAMAFASVGVAMRGGLDAAGEAAGVVLMGDRLGQVVEAIDLSRAAAATIRQNLAWALAYNAVGIPLAAGALLPSLGVVSGHAAGRVLRSVAPHVTWEPWPLRSCSTRPSPEV